jgi:hypothetical protein
MPSHLVLTFLSGIIVTGRHIRDRSVSSGMRNISVAFDDHTFSMYKSGIQMQMIIYAGIPRDRFCENQFVGGHVGP